MTTVMITLWNPLAAGAPVMAAQFAEGLVAAGHTVVVAHGPRPSGSTTPDVIDRLRSTATQVVSLDTFEARHALVNLRRCTRLARDTKVDVVLSFQQRDRVLGAAVARRVGAPLVVHCGGHPTVHGNLVARRAKAAVQRVALRRAALVVCPSPAVRRAVVDRFDVDPHRAPVLFNGIDTARVARTASIARASSPPSTVVRLASVGRTQWEKGHDLALQALASLPEPTTPWHYTVFGDRTGSDDDAHDERVAHLLDDHRVTDRVSMAGWSSDVATELGRTDVYLHPSRREGWPLAVCEAMAAGCPSIISDCAGRPPGFVDGHHGWIVPTDDIDALRDVLTHALALSATDRAEIGANGASFAAEHFDIGGCRGQMTAWIEEIAARRR